jgi:hypothetical protein
LTQTRNTGVSDQTPRETSRGGMEDGEFQVDIAPGPLSTHYMYIQQQHPFQLQQLQETIQQLLQQQRLISLVRSSLNRNQRDIQQLLGILVCGYQPQPSETSSSCCESLYGRTTTSETSSSCCESLYGGYTTTTSETSSSCCESLYGGYTTSETSSSCCESLYGGYKQSQLKSKVIGMKDYSIRSPRSCSVFSTQKMNTGVGL